MGFHEVAAVELVRAYHKIPTPRLRKRIFDLVEVMAAPLHGVPQTRGRATS